jgi:hypothetical protein
MVGSGFVTSQEIFDWMSAAWQELYGLATIDCEDLIVKQVTTVVTAGMSIIALPTAFKRLRGVRIANDTFLTPISLREMQNLDRVGRTGRPAYYWLNTDQANASPVITILPALSATYSIVVYYQPALDLTDAASVTASIPQLASWDEYVVLSAAIKCKDKEESSVSVLIGERTALLASMRNSWTPMDTSEAGRVVQISGRRQANMRAYDYQGPDDDY